MATLVRWEPFRELAALQNEMSRFMNGAPRRATAARRRPGCPTLDVWETDERDRLRVRPAGHPRGRGRRRARRQRCVTGERSAEQTKPEPRRRVERRPPSASRSAAEANVIASHRGLSRGAVREGRAAQAAQARAASPVVELGEARTHARTLREGRRAPPVGRAVRAPSTATSLAGQVPREETSLEVASRMRSATAAISRLAGRLTSFRISSAVGFWPSDQSSRRSEPASRRRTTRCRTLAQVGAQLRLECPRAQVLATRRSRRRRRRGSRCARRHLQRAVSSSA